MAEFQSKWQNPCQVVQREFLIPANSWKDLGRAKRAKKDGEATHQEAPTIHGAGRIGGGHVLPKLWSLAYSVRTRTVEGTTLLLETLPETKGNGLKYLTSSLFPPSHLYQFPPLLKLSEKKLAKSTSDVTCRIEHPVNTEQSRRRTRNGSDINDQHKCSLS